MIRARIAELSLDSASLREKYREEAKRAESGRTRTERIAAIAVLSRVPNHGQFRVLCRLAQYAPYDIRGESYYGLGILNDPAAVPFLLQRLQHEEDFFSALAALRLLRYGLSGHEPLFAGGYVAEYPLKEPGLPDLPEYSREDVIGDYERWWAENKDRLMRERHVEGDFWAR